MHHLESLSLVQRRDQAKEPRHRAEVEEEKRTARERAPSSPRGEAGDAEIGANVGQMAFDIAGSFYFSDTANQRVRRVDAVTGIISTIAGTGTAGYAGDNGAGTAAQLSSPTGVAVDSQGQVYIISGAAATGTAQVIRKLGPNGLLAFGSQLRGSASSAHLVTMANTGNAALTLTNAVITGTNAGDFSIDPNTTSCALSSQSTLYAGQSCKVGVLFKPGAAGARSANLVLLDNTVTAGPIMRAYNVTAATSKTKLASSANPAMACTTLNFSVTVTGASGAQPSGTVQLKKGATVLATASLKNGTARLATSKLAVGTNVLTARYGGDARNLASTSAALDQVVSPGSGSCNGVVSPNPL